VPDARIPTSEPNTVGIGINQSEEDRRGAGLAHLQVIGISVPSGERSTRLPA
jgi:hypothetical protein